MAAEPKQIVSTSLCGDGYVLALAEPSRIKTLSWQADGPLSLAPKDVRGKAGAWPEAESLLAQAPAKLVLGPGDKPAATQLAQSRGSQVHVLPWTDGFAGIEAAIQGLGEFLHETERAALVVLDMQNRLQHLAERKQRRNLDDALPLRVLYLTPTLGTAGAGTMVDAAIRAAGGQNLADDLGISGWGQIPIEQLVTHPPDLILKSFFTDGPPSAVQFRSNHFVLRQISKKTPSLEIPGALWVCGGPYLIRAAEQIADQLDLMSKGEPS
ncbi:MAG: hypothetical protein COA47_00300 [Robiginitomaculum sp.]|nr:MAG: hypothetical protein COA47_00300 [Robiginitomaculum sp.]